MSIPRIAVFKPSSELERTFSTLFTRHEYSVRWVDKPVDILDLIRDETQEFDVVVIPSSLLSNLSPISACIQCRAEVLIQDTPILAINNIQGSSALAGLYGAGADVVVNQEIDSEHFYQQVCALARLKRIYSEMINKQIHSAAVQHPVVQAFDGMREGFLLFDSTFNLVYVNLAATVMLGEKTNALTELPEPVLRQFVPLIKEHLAECQLANTENQQGFSSAYDCSLIRADQQSFSTSLAISSIFNEHQKVVGYAMFLTDLAEIHHLGNLLMQSQRTRSLCLLATSACQQLIGDMLGGTLLAPYRAIQQYLDSRPRNCSLEAVLSDLMETLDLLINPNISIKTNISRDLQLAVSASDLFILLGQIILHAIEHAGTRGDVALQSSDYDALGMAAITITSQTRRQSHFIAKDRIGRLINHDIASLNSLEDLNDKTGSGLSVAQNIAESYGSTIDYQTGDDTTIRLRVRLPGAR